jgi:hypothetical protein
MLFNSEHNELQVHFKVNMGDRLAVAYEADNTGPVKFILACHREDESAVFDSRHAARCQFHWTYARQGPEQPEAVYIHIPKKQVQFPE